MGISCEIVEGKSMIFMKKIFKKFKRKKKHWKENNKKLEQNTEKLKKRYNENDQLKENFKIFDGKTMKSLKSRYISFNISDI